MARIAPTLTPLPKILTSPIKCIREYSEYWSTVWLCDCDCDCTYVPLWAYAMTIRRPLLSILLVTNSSRGQQLVFRYPEQYEQIYIFFFWKILMILYNPHLCICAVARRLVFLLPMLWIDSVVQPLQPRLKKPLDLLTPMKLYLVRSLEASCPLA